MAMTGSATVMSPPNSPTCTSRPPLVSAAKANRAVAVPLTRSITARTGPPAAAMMRSATPSPVPSTVAVAPARRAMSRFSALTSTEMMLRCPIAFSTAMALSPRPPAPTSTTGASGGSGMIFLMAE